MTKEHSLEELRKRAHVLNCQLFEEEFSAREIEIVGYYLHRIAASYLSYFTHKEYEKTMKDKILVDEKNKEEYVHL